MLLTYLLFSQICAGAVQCPLVADLWPSDSGPALLSARALCCAQPNVQLHHEHALTNEGFCTTVAMISHNRPCRDTASLHCRRRPPRWGHSWTNQLQSDSALTAMPGCPVYAKCPSQQLEGKKLDHLNELLEAWKCSLGQVLSSWNACIYLIYCMFLNV